MAQKPLYRYFAKPLTDNTKKMLTARLADLNEGCEVENKTIKVNGKKVLGVYHVTQTILTELSHTDAYLNILTFIQEDEGQIRRYTFSTSKTRISIQTKEIKRVDMLLAGLTSKRPNSARPKGA